MAPRKPAPDQQHRDAAVAERERNVLVDAGAGTGKTTILVDRLVDMVAPARGGPAIPITRLAAITFTRKAAGELRLRIRERLLEALAEAPAGGERHDRLREALAGVDTAYIGTIHAFADRLLRLRPVEAELSPSYDIAEDDQDRLVAETAQVLLDAVQSGTLATELAGTPAEAAAAEATAVVLSALEAGLLAQSRDVGWTMRWGIDGLVAGFIEHRDVPPPLEAPAIFDTPAFAAAVAEFLAVAGPVRGPSPGARWISRTAAVLRELRAIDDPVVIFRRLRRQLDRAPDAHKRDGYGGDEIAWQAWKQIARAARPGDSLWARLRAPADRWLATRLARLFPVAVALYEKVKARRRALDQLDLLVKLRDLLAGDRAVRRDFQRLFEHVFVDEFQDTDPLQAEIVLFLCEAEPRAASWDDVALRPGALTIVGDPKQSIYRFRRADVAVYDRVREVVRRGSCLEATLSANFRSVPGLIGWLNDRFERVLGRSPDGRPFDRATGIVYQQPLLPGRPGARGPAVHVLPLDFADGGTHGVDAYRQLEGRALARYLGWLVARSDVTIEDPLDGTRRRVRYGDVAVLAVSTWRLSLLFPALDAAGIPYASRGGRLFLEDPLHRQVLLGLRALADPDDGVAMAALLRPPFFAVDPADLLRERHARTAGEGDLDDGIRRARQARDIAAELRRRRLDRSPGTTARDLLDRTALARSVALGPNGAQRLARLRELCLLLDEVATRDGLDYDAATARVRQWVDDPAQVDPPYPVGSDAVQVLTVHQAKGLEFPVVVLWDGKGQWDTRLDMPPWRPERDGRGWLLALDGLSWEEPAGQDLLGTERRYTLAERRRVLYVAATRARDLLVVPRAGAGRAERHMCAALLAEAPPELVRELETYRDDAPPAWASAGPPEPALVAGQPRDAADLERATAEAWTAAAARAARPRSAPASVSEEAHARAAADEATEAVRGLAARPRAGRFGSLFGTVVHRAVGSALRQSDADAEEAVRQAARAAGLTEHLEEAVADVRRALAALRAEGLGGPLGPALRVEYPVAAAWDGGLLLGGYIDLVGAPPGRLDLIDLKTDAPPAGPVELVYPQYAAQVRTYGRLLALTGLAAGRTLRCGLLFTADGAIRWVAP